MNRIVYMLVTILALTSCAETYETYQIQGSSMVSMDHDNKLALKVFKDDGLADFDSCEVVHGNFSFVGRYDTTQLGFLVTEDIMNPVPLIIETGGMITVSLQRGMNRVSGTPLNDKLYAYLEHYNQLRNYAMTMKARSMEMMRLRNQMDSLETRFIIDNSDNLAGMCAFMQMVSELVESQMLITPQLELIMQQASESFRNNPFVSNYYKAAKSYMNSQQSKELPVALPMKEETEKPK